MSNGYINGVNVHSRAKRSARAVLLVIANRAQPDGVSSPGHALISREAGVSERTVTRAIATLVELGELAIIAPELQHKCPRYRILLCPEKSAQGRQIDYADPIQGRQIDARVDNLSSRVDKLSEDYYTRDLNPIEPNRTQGEIAREPTAAPKISPARKEPKLHRLHARPKPKGRYLKDVFFVDGYIPAGTGTNAIQVYYERFDIRDDVARLTDPKEDDLVRACTDLERLRAVVTEYSRTNYKPGRVDLILDWYRDGPPSQRKPSHENVAFGLQQYNRRNGANHAASVTGNPLGAADEEQPDYDSEFGRAIRESQRRAAEEHAAKQAARRGVQLSPL